MPKNDEKQIILDYIIDNTFYNGYGEDGEEYIEPLYVRVDDIVAEFDVDEEEITDIAKENGYIIFDNKADVAEGLYIAHPDFDIEQFKVDFKKFYDVEPEIEMVFQPEPEEGESEKKVPIEPVEEGITCCSICGAEECNYNDPETSEPLCADCFAERCEILKLDEDTVKQGDKWVNKGKEGTHGKFKTKKAADAQRKAMFANGYKESLEDDGIIKLDDVTAFWDSNSFNDEGEEYFYEIEYHADEDRFIYNKVLDTTTLDCTREDMVNAGIDVDNVEKKLKTTFISEDYDYTYWCVSDGVNPRRSVLFTSEESAVEFAKANKHFKFVDKYTHGNPVKVWTREEEKIFDGNKQESLKEDIKCEWCVMDKDGNNKYNCFTDKEEAIKHCKEIEDAFSVVEVHYDKDGEEISAETVFEKDFGENLTEAKEVKPDIPEDFDGRMDYLAADEQEAIDGYELVIAALGEDEANVKEQLEKIKIEEIAHKEFLEKVKADHNLIYTEPLEPEPEVEVEDEVELEEDKKKVTSSEIEAFINDIYNLRKEGMEEEGDFSLKNLVFKEFRSLGYLDHLKDLKNMLKGEELSLESLNSLDEELDTSKYNTRDKLAQLRKDYPEDGTYSADKDGNLTREELSDGFMVSFFRPEIKDEDIELVLKTIGNKLGNPYLGIFEDAPEISYKFDDEDRAMEFARLFNQRAIWDNENSILIINPSFKEQDELDYSSLVDLLKEFINK